MNVTTRYLIQDSGDDFKKWMSSFNPSLLSKYSTFSSESKETLRNLHKLSQQADSSVVEVIKSVKQFTSEYDGLFKKLSDHLQFLLMEDELELCDDVYQKVQELAKVFMKGSVGYTADISASSLASAALSKAASTRQQLSLLKDITIIQKKNRNLREILQFFKRESKLAKEEIAKEQLNLKNTVNDAKNQVEIPRLNVTGTTLRLQLDELGLPPNVSSQTIMETHQEFITYESDIKALKEKLKKYGALPPSIAEASAMVEDSKRHLASVVQEFKSKLTTFHARVY